MRNKGKAQIFNAKIKMKEAIFYDMKLNINLIKFFPQAEHFQIFWFKFWRENAKDERFYV